MMMAPTADALPEYWRNIDGGRLLVPKATPALARLPREAYSRPRHASTANAVSTRFRAHSDNSATVTLLTSGKSRSTKSITVAKLLHLLLARQRIAIDAFWVAGETDNGGADDLSRGRVAHFCECMRSDGFRCVHLQVPASIRSGLRRLLAR